MLLAGVRFVGAETNPMVSRDGKGRKRERLTGD